MVLCVVLNAHASQGFQFGGIILVVSLAVLQKLSFDCFIALFTNTNKLKPISTVNNIYIYI